MPSPLTDAILVVNAGSSSIKFTQFRLDGEALRIDLQGKIEELYGAARFAATRPGEAIKREHAWPAGQPPGHGGALEFLLRWLDEHGRVRLAGVGHRVVHGGVRYSGPVRVDTQVLADLDTLVPLAPLHQPHNLAPIRAILATHPDLPQVACFDTAFHRHSPALAQAFALPPAITRRGVHRYGFHGLSYEYIASVLPQVDARAGAGRAIVLHLGNGASMCAMHAGKSIASTMGFTALDGLPMGTRCGNLDPGVVLYLMQSLGMDAEAIEALLYRESGLLGVSGVSSDMRTLLQSDAPSARFAVDLFTYRAGREIGSLAAALGGLDAIVFTAGIGEHADPVRAAICRHAAWLGVELDDTANRAHAQRISTAQSRCAAYVIPTDEELMIARQTRALLG